MNNDTTRLRVQIDLFELKQQPALVLPTLLPQQLIAAILDEFRLKGQHMLQPGYRNLEYLSDNAAHYQLHRAATGVALAENLPLQAQLAADEQLQLVERQQALPAGTTRPATPLYLREQATGVVYQITWLPAIIGRPDAQHQQNALLAVNLAAYLKGQHVSRRHAQLTEANGQLFVEPLGPNPTSLLDSTATPQPLAQVRTPIGHGSVIYLDSSTIALKVIRREETNA